MRQLTLVVVLTFGISACVSTPTNGKPAYTCGPVTATTKFYFNSGNDHTVKYCATAWSSFEEGVLVGIILSPVSLLLCPVVAGIGYVTYLAMSPLFVSLLSFEGEHYQKIECPPPGEEPVPAPWKV